MIPDRVGAVREDGEKRLLGVLVLDAEKRVLLGRLVSSEFSTCEPKRQRGRAGADDDEERTRGKVVSLLLEDDRHAVELDLGERMQANADGDRASNRERLLTDPVSELLHPNQQKRGRTLPLNAI